jgi:Tfp pilus assembly protein FimT
VTCARRLRRSGDGGFGSTELIIVAAVVGISTTAACVLFARFLQNQQVNGASGQVRALLSEAREIAIAANASYRVEFDVASNRVRFVKPPTCTTGCTPWRGSGTDGQGYRQLENQARITSVTANPVFNPLGTASTPATITVKPARGNECRQVIVSPSGRIRQTTPTSCP